MGSSNGERKKKTAGIKWSLCTAATMVNIFNACNSRSLHVLYHCVIVVVVVVVRVQLNSCHRIEIGLELNYNYSIRPNKTLPLYQRLYILVYMYIYVRLVRPFCENHKKPKQNMYRNNISILIKIFVQIFYSLKYLFDIFSFCYN